MPTFQKVLVANRGEIALRVMRTCRRLGIRTVAVHSEVDAGCQFVEEADEAIALLGNRVQDSYLDVDKLTKAIRDSGAEAVHPGYGMLSEDASFAASVAETGARFIGPPPQALAALGDKITARGLARKVGLRPPPGTAEAVDAEDLDRLLEIAEEVRYPVMVKAAAGGGGIGMQRADDAEALKRAIATCVSRGQAAFGDPRVYLEHAIDRARHIEVQVARDAHGGVTAMGDRECSVQRRHQKILEECPSPAVFLTPERRQSLYRDACALLEEVDYVGVATVEFLADSSQDLPELYFLEVNARIQVEHPVTELVFGIDLVELQLVLAAGGELPADVESATPNGHAIEVRVYAEDPRRGFLPQPGTLSDLEWPAGVAVRVDPAYRKGEVISPYYDPLIGKLVCHGDDRLEALERLRDALAKTRMKLDGPKGPRMTNLEFLGALVDSPSIAQGDYDTQIVAREFPSG